MKKLFLIAAAAFLFTGVAFANDGGGKKKCAKGESCCKKDAKKEDCKKDSKEKACCKKDAKKTTAKVEPKKA
jgi:hypothetical protein